MESPCSLPQDIFATEISQKSLSPKQKRNRRRPVTRYHIGGCFVGDSCNEEDFQDDGDGPGTTMWPKFNRGKIRQLLTV
jgi:hypothetical protein